MLVKMVHVTVNYCFLWCY